MKYFAGLNQKENEILVSLKGSCDLFSVTSLQEQCKDFLNRYGSYFSQKHFNEIESRSACQGIGICNDNYHESTSSTPISTSTKYGKCIFGIKYWCTSRENAALCNVKEIDYFYSKYSFFSF
jgi:hypothetical protein